MKRKKINALLSVYVFKDSVADCYVAYCPSLNLCGYDRTKTAAKADFQYVLNEYFTEQIEQGTLLEDLRMHGWKVEDDRLSAPTFNTMYRAKNSQLRSIVTENMGGYEMYNVSCPAIL